MIMTKHIDVMKRIAIYLIMALSPAAMTSCLQDKMDGDMPDDQMVEVVFNVGMEETMQTRAVIGENPAWEKTLSFGVYRNGTLLPNVAEIIQDFGTGTKATVKATLAKGLTYDLVFWAQAPGDEYYTVEEPFAAELELQLYRNDLKKPHYTKTDLSLIHPETREKCFTLTAAMWLYEEPYTVLQERAYDQEDIFHLNDEYLQRVKEAYIPSLAVSFLPVIAEMPAGVINDILRFAEETDILVSLGVE